MPHIESQLKRHFAKFEQLTHVQDVRVLGAIGVIELVDPVDMATIQAAFVDNGIWVRPFGKLVYIMPQYVISEEELETLCNGIYTVIINLK